VLVTANSPEFRSLSPRLIVPRLADRKRVHRERVDLLPHPPGGRAPRLSTDEHLHSAIRYVTPSGPARSQGPAIARQAPRRLHEASPSHATSLDGGDPQLVTRRRCVLESHRGGGPHQPNRVAGPVTILQTTILIHTGADARSRKDPLDRLIQTPVQVWLYIRCGGDDFEKPSAVLQCGWVKRLQL
jgi:hypothetical protein